MSINSPQRYHYRNNVNRQSYKSLLMRCFYKTKVLSVLLTAVLCTIYALVMLFLVSNNTLSTILLPVGLFIIIYGISKLEQKLPKNDKKVLKQC